MTKFHAQPYDISATGLYFESAEEFYAKISKAVNDYGDPLEEFEIQFIDGNDVDCALAEVWSVNQANIGAFFDAVNDWDDEQKKHYIIAVGECGYSHEQVADKSDNVDIQLYQVESLKELAEQFVDDGLFGEIPEQLQFYIDYDLIARDLAVEYSETIIAGERFAYVCA